MFSLFIWTWCTFATDLSFTLVEWDWDSLLFVLTCRLTENYRKIRRSCNSKWRCVFLTVLQYLLVQTFSISLSSSGLLVSSGTIWYVIYETRKTVFDHNYKHREDSANDYMKDNIFQLRKKISRLIIAVMHTHLGQFAKLKPVIFDELQGVCVIRSDI